jgi:cysteine-rich repeat protein
VIRDFARAPAVGVWLAQALANSLFGVDVDPTVNDIEADFNSNLGAAECLAGAHWHLGFDGKPPSGQIDFVTIALHELAHGLGFLELVNLQTGAKLLGLDDAFIRLLENRQTGKRYPEMADEERVAASMATDRLVWTGEQTTATAEEDKVTRGADEETGYVKLYAPEWPEPGSSVAHFSDDVSPSELMSPFYLGPNHNVDLAVAAFADMGWQIAASSSCGNGALNLGETCDDHNRADGDGCDHACRVETCFTCAGEPSTCGPEPSCGLTLDHFHCYQAQTAKGAALFTPRKAKLADEFATGNITLVKPTNLCSPTRVNEGSVFDPTAHLTCYQAKGAIAGQGGGANQEIRVANQFGGDQHLWLSRLQSLCLPSMTDNTPSPLNVDAYACYQAEATLDSPPLHGRGVQFSDAFSTGAAVVRKAVNFCAPVAMGHASIAPEAALTCYHLKKPNSGNTAGSRTVVVENAFGAKQTLATSSAGVLCVPSRKIGQ